MKFSELPAGARPVAPNIGRINPARGRGTYGALRAAQAPAGRAAALRDALAVMHERGEAGLHADTLARALRVPDGRRRTALTGLPPEPDG